METRRVFLGVRPTAESLKELTSVQQALKARWGLDPGTRWTPSEQLHLTLHFLGGIGEDTLARLLRMVEEVGRQAQTSQTLDALIAFPQAGYARVAGVGSRTIDPLLAKLWRELESGLTKLGIELEERPYVPHLSMVRFSPARSVRVDSDPVNLRFAIEAVTVYESRLLPDGAHYEIIGEVPLAPLRSP